MYESQLGGRDSSGAFRLDLGLMMYVMSKICVGVRQANLISANTMVIYLYQVKGACVS